MLNKTLDITVIILTYNEEIHIRRCLENVTPFAKKVFVVDSPSTDRTVEICREFENVDAVMGEGMDLTLAKQCIENAQIGRAHV